MATEFNKAVVTISIQRLKSLSRISAWILLTLAAILILSGWGITRTEIIYKITLGLIDRRIANYIHRFATIPLSVFFMSHVLINARLSWYNKIPHRIKIIDGFFFLIGALVIALVSYMEFWV
jgi:hypothetical protein